MEKYEEHAQGSFVELFNRGRQLRVPKVRLEKEKLVDEKLMYNIPSFLPLQQKKIGKKEPIRNQLKPRKSKG
jgi:hypothetical protein